MVRNEADGVQLYSHVGTGNYHTETAKTYVDLGLLTADQDGGHDLTRMFSYFTGHSLNEEYRKLLVAPAKMREEFTRRIRREVDHARDGGEGRIVAKMNSPHEVLMERARQQAPERTEVVSDLADPLVDADELDVF